MCEVNSYQKRGLKLHVGVSNPHERNWTKCSDVASVDNFPRPSSFRFFFFFFGWGAFRLDLNDLQKPLASNFTNSSTPILSSIWTSLISNPLNACVNLLHINWVTAGSLEVLCCLVGRAISFFFFFTSVPLISLPSECTVDDNISWNIHVKY